MNKTSIRRGRLLLFAAATILVVLAASAAAARAITDQPVETPTGGPQYVTSVMYVDQLSRASGVAPCPVGTTAINGGVSSDSEPFTRVVTSAADVDSSGWRVDLWNLHPSKGLTAHVWAECLGID
jgi:hypothetical protein